MPKSSAIQNSTALAREIDRELREIRQILKRPIEADIARGQLTGPQMSAMHVLVTSDGLSLKDLSRQLGLAHSTVSGIVDRLENRGMVERLTDEADKRSSKIVVTNQVREYVQKVIPEASVGPLAAALNSASAAERQLITDGIRTLHRILKRTSASFLTAGQ